MSATPEVKYAADGVTPLSVVRERLEWVKQAILSEPQKYDQDSYVLDGDDGTCGTGFCIAGWLDVHLNGFAAYRTHKSHEVEQIGYQSLGLSWEDGYLPLFEAVDGGYLGVPEAGTLEHAQLGVKRIDEYLAEIGA